ncbi:MAG: hypothetical protein SWQ30_04380 [Thermodesulfobacteriota bacterium]|nr:hypothetical protein [Thermodesulfobacteriota bacterium]
MKGVKLMKSFVAVVVMVVLSGSGVYAEYHHVDDCSVCHYAGLDGSDCTASPNLVLIRDFMDTPCGDLTQTVFGPFVVDVPPYNGVCQVCHESVGACSTTYYRNDGTGDDHPVYKPGSMGPTDCNICHLHAPHEFGHEGSVGTGCDTCHGQGGEAGTAQSHGTHTKVGEGKGPGAECSDCHDVNNFPCFADGAASLSATTACDGCHSPGGAFDGVDDLAVGAKSNWGGGIYETNGTALKFGKEKWCVSCHDDVPAQSAANWIEVVLDDPEASFDPYLAPPAGYPDGTPEFNPPAGNPASQWAYYWGTSKHYGNGFRYTEAGDGSRIVTWTPDLPEAAEYTVYAWWTSGDGVNRVTDAPYTINYQGGSTTIRVNQEVNGRQWNDLGTFPFAAGTAGSVVQSNDSSDGTDLVVADAVKFVKNGPGTYAPNVGGDNATYGFYATGHGAGQSVVGCLHCHDASKNHIDHVYRTYDVDESDNYAVAVPYCTSYRLKDIKDCEDAMYLPRRRSSNPIHYWNDFALCFSCHNKDELLDGMTHTNFVETFPTMSTGSEVQSHFHHLQIKAITHSDTDYDGVKDSFVSCILCHNVHGSPSKMMIRHGELISEPGFDKTPGLNFSYLDQPSEHPFATATFTTPTPLQGGSYNVYAQWSAHIAAYRTTAAKYTIYYTGGSEVVLVDQTDQGPGGGQMNLLGTYPYDAGAIGEVVLDNDFPLSKVSVIADAVQWEFVGGGETVVVDDAEADLVNDAFEWQYYNDGGEQAYNGSFHYIKSHAIPKVVNPERELAESAGGIMQMFKHITQNYLCQACHSSDHAGYVRTPYMGPKVLTVSETERVTVDHDGSRTKTIMVQVLDHNDNVNSVTIDLSPVGESASQEMDDNGDGTYSYDVYFPSPDEATYTFEITATDDDSETASGTVEVTVVEAGAIYLDDANAVFDPDSNPPPGYPLSIPPSTNPSWGDPDAHWTYYWLSDQQYRNGFRYVSHTTGSAWATGTWTFDVPETGDYYVYAWWSANTAAYRATDVPYTIHHSGGTETIRVDQTNDGPGGGQWNQLGTGTWNFTAGTSWQIVISNDADNTIIADGIKLVKAE